MTDVVVLGSYNLDLVAMVPRFPSAGETLHARDLLRGHGGKGSNQAVAAARAGARTVFAGSTGADAAGQQARHLWQTESIAALVTTRADLPTGLALILLAPSGENRIVVVAGANAAVDAAQAARAAETARPGSVVVGQLETPQEATAAFFAAARARGATTVLNTAPAGPALLPTLLSATDILVANEGEAALLCAAAPDTGPARIGARLAAMAGSAAIITCGAAGAMLFTRAGDRLHQPAAPVDVVDTTGAGDALVGAFAAALSRGDPTEAALAEGVAAGSLACTRCGAVAALPDAAAIRAMRTRLPPSLPG